MERVTGRCHRSTGGWSIPLSYWSISRDGNGSNSKSTNQIDKSNRRWLSAVRSTSLRRQPRTLVVPPTIDCSPRPSSSSRRCQSKTLDKSNRRWLSASPLSGREFLAAEQRLERELARAFVFLLSNLSETVTRFFLDR